MSTKKKIYHSYRSVYPVKLQVFFIDLHINASVSIVVMSTE